MAATRTLVVWCPDWPLVAASIAADVPAATFLANRVVACTAAARADGVQRGMRRREAQGRCPELLIVPHDPARDSRAFESVVAVIDAFTTQVEITRAGVCSLPTRGPSRYFGGDESLADLIVDAVTQHGVPCRVGVADGPFTAMQAARTTQHRHTIVPPGESAAFLAPLPVGVLDEPELTNLLARLGLRTLGAFAAVGVDDVIGRFGTVGVTAHRRARGLDDRRIQCHVPREEMPIEICLEPPADRIDTAAFAAKSLADAVCANLATAGLVCTCIRIEAETEHGEGRARVWRHHRAFTPATIAERMRWQLEGWQIGGTTGGLTLLRLVPQEVEPDNGRAEGFWGATTEADERAARGFARVQGLLGPEAVVTAVLGGGRSPAEQVRLVPWGDPRDDSRADPTPWPGRLPSPSPAVVPAAPWPASVVDASGVPVTVTGRSEPTAAPARLSVDGGPWQEVVAWSGPWTADERWWDPVARRRWARYQMVVGGGDAYLVTLQGGRWWVEALYD